MNEQLHGKLKKQKSKLELITFFLCLSGLKKITKFVRNNAKKSDKITLPCNDSPFVSIQIDQQIFHAPLFLPFVR